MRGVEKIWEKKKGVEGTTHGMCAECKAKFDKKIEEEDNEQNKQ